MTQSIQKSSGGSFYGFLSRVRGSLFKSEQVIKPQMNSLSTAESIHLSNYQEGQATLNFNLSNDEMIKRWNTFKTNGNYIPLNIQNEAFPEKELFQFVEQFFEKDEKVNIANFMKDLVMSDKEKVAIKGMYLADKSFLDLFRNELVTQGITFEQLSAIGNGDFTFDAYRKMVLTQQLTP